MTSIDSLAYVSGLRRQDPLIKLAFAFLAMALCLTLKSLTLSLVTLAAVSLLTLFAGKTPVKFYLKLLALPVIFTGMSAVVIASAIADTPAGFALSIEAAGKYVGFTAQGIRQAADLGALALGNASCMFFVALSTPMADLTGAMHRARIPAILVEIMLLTYRFISVLMETALEICTAQDARMGYTGLRNYYNSAAVLAAALMVRAFNRVNKVYTAMESRLYEGQFRIMERKYPHRLKDSLQYSALLVLLFLTAML